MLEWERLVLLLVPAFVFSIILVILIGERGNGHLNANGRAMQAKIQSVAAVSGMGAAMAMYTYCPTFFQLNVYQSPYVEVVRWILSIAAVFVVTPLVLLVARWTPVIWDCLKDNAGWNG